MQRNRVIWVLNAACPSRCSYCDIESQRATRALDPAAVRDAAEQILAAGFQNVTFVGGEPLLSNALPGALAVLRGRIEIGLFTGGIPGDPEPLVDLVAQGVDRLVLSIDAGDDQTNDQLRGRAGTTRDLFAFAAAVRRRLPTIDISVNSVVTRKSVATLPAVWERVRPLGPTAWALTLAGDNFQTSPAEHFLTRAQIEQLYLETVPALAATIPTQLIVLPVPLAYLEAGIPPRRWGSEAARHRAQIDGVERGAPDGSAGGGGGALPRGARSIDQDFDAWTRGDYNAAFVARHGCPLVGLDVTIGVGGEVHPCSQAPIIKPEYVVGDVRRGGLAAALQGDALRTFGAGVPHPPCKRCWAPSNVPAELLRRLTA